MENNRDSLSESNPQHWAFSASFQNNFSLNLPPIRNLQDDKSQLGQTSVDIFNRKQELFYQENQLKQIPIS